MVQPFFFIAEHFLDSDKVGKEISGTVSRLFGVNDRGVRGLLLQKAPFFSQHMDRNALNQFVFEPMCSGFSDSSSALRELTLKATLGLVPHLTAPNLEKLSRYLVRLQSDPEASIRTNTVIFFCKLAPHLSDTTREKLLLSAFVRAMKDPFTPCRLAALKSTLNAKELFTAQSIACKVLPAVTPQLLDSAAEVRREAFQVVDDFLFQLRQESERMNAMQQENQQQQQQMGLASVSSLSQESGGGAPVTAPAAIAPAPSSGGYLSGISSWMVSSARASSPTPQQPAAPPPATAPVAAPAAPRPAVPMQSAGTVGYASTSIDVGDGWGDEDDFLDDGGANTASNTAATTAPQGSKSGNLFDPASGDEDDLFGGLNDKPIRTAALQKKPKGKLSMPSSKKSTSAAPKPAITKLQVDDDMEDGWDDF